MAFASFSFVSFSFLQVCLFILSTITLLNQTWATMTKFWLECSQASMTLGLIPKVFRIGLYDVCETEADDNGTALWQNKTCYSVSEAGLENFEELKKMDVRGVAFMYFSAPLCLILTSFSVMMGWMMIGMPKKSIRELIWLKIVSQGVSSVLGVIGCTWIFVSYGYNVDTLKYQIDDEPEENNEDQGWSDWIMDSIQDTLKETYNENVQDSFRLGPGSIVFLIGSVIGVINTGLAILLWTKSKEFQVLDSDKTSENIDNSDNEKTDFIVNS